jgi:hypothetical protein
MRSSAKFNLPPFLAKRNSWIVHSHLLIGFLRAFVAYMYSELYASVFDLSDVFDEGV